MILNGSQRPIAKENATLMPIFENGFFVLYLLGGSPMITGQFMFEIYRINPDKQTWEQVKYERPIVQTWGSRPVYKKEDNGQFQVYFFSGQVPLQRINAGVKVCAPEMHEFDSS